MFKQRFKSVILKASAAFVGNRQGKVIFYHDVYRMTSTCKTPTRLVAFEEQILLAKARGWESVRGCPFEEQTFQIQFDDGFRGVYECRDALLALGVHPTVNLSVARIGEPGYLKKGEILELQELGFVFQSHSWNHVWLPDCSDKDLNHELADSRNWLEDLLQRPVDQICFPRGLFSRRVYETALKAGYQWLASCIPGAANAGVLPHVLPRQLVQNVSPSDFVSILNGGLEPFKKRYFERQYVEDKK